MNQAVKFVPGQKVYSETGDIGEYVSALPEGAHVVRQLFESDFEDDDQEPEFYPRRGVLETWRRCYNEAPRHLVDAIMAEKLAAAEKLRLEIRDLEAEARKLKQDEKQTKQRLAEIEALQHLDDVFAGRITHYAIENSSDEWGVFTHAQACGLDGNASNYDDRRLTLYSRNLKEAQWTFFSSGRDYPRERKCFLFTSEAAARAKVQEMIAAHLQEQLKNPNYWQIDRFIANAQNYGVPVPAELTEKVIAAKVSAARSTVEKANKDLAKALTELHALSPTAAELDALVQAGVALDRR